MATDELDGWMPIRLYWQQTDLWVDWCYLGDVRLTAPFYDHTIEACLQHPFNLAFRRQTSIDVVTNLKSTHPGLRPNGFIFHASRCGSTLVAQMLATLPTNIVVSEASLLEVVLRTDRQPIGVAPK